MTLRAGFVGPGHIIGKPMAGRPPAAGFETTVYDVAEAPVAEPSHGVGVCVPEDERRR